MSAPPSPAAGCRFSHRDTEPPSWDLCFPGTVSTPGTFRGLRGHERNVDPKTTSHGAHRTRVRNGWAELCELRKESLRPGGPLGAQEVGRVV